MTQQELESIENYPEFVALIERYKAITIEEIEEQIEVIEDGELRPSAREMAHELTGYGSYYTCTLCERLDTSTYNEDENCKRCVFVKITQSQCTSGINRDTYKAIGYSESTEELKDNFNKRAQYMQGLLDKATSITC